MTMTRTAKLTLVLVALGAVTVFACLIADVPPALRLLAAGGAILVYVLLGWLLRRSLAEESQVVSAVADGIASLRDQDYSLSIAAPETASALRRLVDAYNGIGQVLRTQRQDLYQRELLLDTVIQATPLALVLTNAHGTILYANLAARQVFGDGHKLEGLAFAALLDSVPAAMRAAFAEDRDSLFTVGMNAESQVFHLSQRRFLLNGQPHRLYLLKQLTRELNAREVATWKRVIRVIAHEINNSVAPIASLAQSGQQLALAPGRSAAAARVRRHRGAHGAPGRVRRGLLAICEAAAAAAGGRALAGIHRGPAHCRAVRERGRVAARAGMVRRAAAAAGPAQSPQELSRGGIGAPARSACRWRPAAAASCSSSSIAAPA